MLLPVSREQSRHLFLTLDDGNNNNNNNNDDVLVVLFIVFFDDANGDLRQQQKAYYEGVRGIHAKPFKNSLKRIFGLVWHQTTLYES